MPQFDMEYNTQKSNLIISEYGRNVQELIRYANTIEDKKQRQKYVEEMINLINIMNPYNRSLEDYKEKLWNHVFRIANYELDVDVPEGITIHQGALTKLDSHLPYPQTEFSFRHYGSYIQNMIRKALEMEEGPKRDAYSEVIASYMKLAYRTWNKEHYVNDEIIKLDLSKLSQGKLTFDDNYAIENLVSAKVLAQTPRSASSAVGRRQQFTKGNNKNHRNNNNNKRPGGSGPSKKR